MNYKTRIYLKTTVCNIGMAIALILADT
jgi:hypothetical protein